MRTGAVLLIAFTVSGCEGQITPPAVGARSSSSTPPVDCAAVSPGPSFTIRRLTTFEYSNTIRDLLGDATNISSKLPAQTSSKQDMFGNDSALQTIGDNLIQTYETLAEEIAARATADSTALARLNSCAANVTQANEAACARAIAMSLASKAYRRQITSSEGDEFVALYTSVRALSATYTFASGVAAMIEAILQAPEFLYRVELGTPVPGNSSVMRIEGREMATRLSYLFWQTMPDDNLFKLADDGMLDTSEGVRAQAKTMLDDPRSHAMVAFFFDNLLPIPDLNSIARDPNLFPNWSSSIGVELRQEVQRDLEYAIYEDTTNGAPPYSPGSLQAILTVPSTFVNEELFNYYGASSFATGTHVTGGNFVKVALNPERRLGLLTTGGMMSGLSDPNLSNAVARGVFVLNKLMCRNLSPPTGVVIKAPDPYAAKTARERLALHAKDPVCAGCHKVIDDIGLTFEIYDAAGNYRTAEHWVDPTTKVAYDTPIDASGAIAGLPGTAKNALDLVKILATSDELGACFSSEWMSFAYGRSLELQRLGSLTDADACNEQLAATAFSKANYNVKELLLALTQTDAFLYRPAAQ
jgi:hypothetical protein